MPLTSPLLGKLFERPADLLAMFVGLAFVVFIRVVFLDFQSIDFVDHTSHWYAAVQADGMGATATQVSNYTPTYMYLLNAVAAMFPEVAPVKAVKLPSLFFDGVCAIMVALIVQLRYPASRVPLAAFMVTLLWPTLVIDGAVWGQADSIYTSFVLLCVYALMTGKSTLAMVAFGIALSIKFQTMFLAPAIFPLWLRGQVRWWTPLLVPVIYVLIMVPAWLEGRPFSELAAVYFDQSQTFNRLHMNAPSLYPWIPHRFYSLAVPGGLLLTTALCSLLAWKVWRSRARLDQSMILSLCLVSLIMAPFFLPKMHDRFFFPADILAICYGFFFPRRYFVPVIIGCTSCIVYARFLLDLQFLPLRGLALLMLFALTAVTFHFFRALKDGEAAPGTAAAPGSRPIGATAS